MRPIATASHGQTMKYASSIIQPVAKLTAGGNTRAVYATSPDASGITTTSLLYTYPIGSSSDPPMAKPNAAPNEPPLDSQSSMTTSQPTPTIVPHPSAK